MNKSDKALCALGIAAELLCTVIGGAVAVTGVLLSFTAGSIMTLAILARNKVKDKEEDVSKFIVGNPMKLTMSVWSIVWPRVTSGKSLAEVFSKSSLNDLQPLTVGKERKAPSEEPLSKPTGQEREGCGAT